MSGVQSSPALDAISDNECRDLLATAQVGHVVLSIGAFPAALPFNSWLISIQRISGRRLTNPVTNPDPIRAERP